MNKAEHHLQIKFMDRKKFNMKFILKNRKGFVSVHKLVILKLFAFKIDILVANRFHKAILHGNV